jgi:hypothetical protein
MITPADLKQERVGIKLAELKIIEKQIIANNLKGILGFAHSCSKNVNTIMAQEICSFLKGLGYDASLTSGDDPREGLYNVIYVNWEKCDD